MWDDSVGEWEDLLDCSNAGRRTSPLAAGAAPSARSLGRSGECVDNRENEGGHIKMAVVNGRRGAEERCEAGKTGGGGWMGLGFF